MSDRQGRQATMAWRDQRRQRKTNRKWLGFGLGAFQQTYVSHAAQFSLQMAPFSLLTFFLTINKYNIMNQVQLLQTLVHLFFKIYIYI